MRFAMRTGAVYQGRDGQADETMLWRDEQIQGFSFWIGERNRLCPSP